MLLRTATPSEPNGLRFNSKDLPIVYEDDKTLIYVNKDGEIFVEAKTSTGGPDLRITPGDNGLGLTAHIGMFVLGAMAQMGVNHHQPVVYLVNR